MTPDAIRIALERAILSSGSDLAKASKELGRNHAYLQQFVRSGKPKYLKEEDRQLLVKLYGIDPRPLMPPPKKLANDVPKSATDSTCRPPRPGDPIKDAREAVIVDTWRKIPKEDQDWVVGIINGILRGRGLPPIAA
jgi:hypothetical protein